MRRVDAIFLVEHVGRELDVACAVQLLARKHHGLEIEVLPAQTSHEYAVRNLETDLLVLPFAYGFDDPYTGDFIRDFPGAKLLNMAWEELIIEVYEQEKLPRDRFTREYILHHAWGEFHKERLVNAGVPADHVFVNGQPAYGLYDPPYKGLFPTREEMAERHGLDPGKRWLLFSENYAWAFYPARKVEELIANGIPKQTIDELSGFCARSLRTVVPWMAALAAKHDMEVILRPRPATLESDFQAVVDECVPERPAGLHVIKRESIREWILVSDVVASSYSTTLIEAAVAGQEAFMVMPLPLPRGLESVWYVHCPQIATEDAFVAACTAQRAAGEVDELTRWARSTLLGRGDPIRGVADLIARLAAPGFPRPELPPRDFFPPRYRGWQALRFEGEGFATLPARLRERRKFRRIRRKLRERVPARSAHVLEPREVPPVLRGWLDPRDLFDSVDVERVGRRWQRHLDP